MGCGQDARGTLRNAEDPFQAEHYGEIDDQVKPQPAGVPRFACEGEGGPESALLVGAGVDDFCGDDAAAIVINYFARRGSVGFTQNGIDR